jgi:hypothetical protein
MATRPEGRGVMHRVEATAPGGEHIDLLVKAAQRRRGAVRVIWDPHGIIEPRFPFDHWGLVGTAVGIVAAIVAAGWFLFG